uniref:Prolyl 4-hydroxylase alpha subunit Fe(2+) 2OG dioxygenase domain-containing protein n=1 Tax=viral metagenome TaxID=1070528 RepID=A0A6C0HZK5_9ZZZZ
MDKIIIQDNFLNQEELDECLKIINNKSWTWGHTSNGFYNDTPFWKMDLIDNEYFSVKIKGIIEKQFSKKFKIKSLYANAHTYGQDGSYHIDCFDPNCYIFCLYLTNIKEENIETAGGLLFFKFSGLNYKICFEPKFNRGIFFPSDYCHKATSFSRYIMDLRVCVAWKLEEII